MSTIDLNADLGEGGDHDAALMLLITSCNIACGGHAGDESTMRASVEAALAAGVAIGAHPGYEDPENFGRKPLQLPADEIAAMIHRQLERLLAIHPVIHHIKPHGALYNQANADLGLATSVVNAIAEMLPSCMLYAPHVGELGKAATSAGLRHCPEGFVDRRYLRDGSLCPHDEEGARIETVNEAAAQALSIAIDAKVISRGHRRIPLHARTLCIHGDSPYALLTLERVRQSLALAGVEIAPV